MTERYVLNNNEQKIYESMLLNLIHKDAFIFKLIHKENEWSIYYGEIYELTDIDYVFLITNGKTFDLYVHTCWDGEYYYTYTQSVRISGIMYEYLTSLNIN